jgi:hypothetical protein
MSESVSRSRSWRRPDLNARVTRSASGRMAMISAPALVGRGVMVNAIPREEVAEASAEAEPEPLPSLRIGRESRTSVSRVEKTARPSSRMQRFFGVAPLRSDGRRVMRGCSGPCQSQVTMPASPWEAMMESPQTAAALKPSWEVMAGSV